MSYNILITGGAGYIGSILVPTLLRKGHKVTVVDTFASGELTLAEAAPFDTFTPVKCDVRNQDEMKKLVADKDIIIPLAALVGAPICKQDPIGATTINRDAIVNMLPFLSKDQRVIYPNTNSGYGIGDKDAFCTETSPLNPISLYGTTKVEAEQAVLSWGGVTFRLATVFGIAPRMRIDLLVNDFTYRAFKDRAVVIFEGHFKRNFIHIRDIANAFMHAIENYDKMKGEAYNVGLSSANLSKIELCERIKKHVPNFVYLESAIGTDPDKRDYIVSNAKLEATGFATEWDLDRGVSELLRGYQMLNNSRYSNV